uniref:Uncharacterized protein n=1 Tax=Romanomermis culicivorax TaxID=13658 RepID=A0A915KEE2_ROMCU
MGARRLLHEYVRGHRNSNSNAAEEIDQNHFVQVSCGGECSVALWWRSSRWCNLWREQWLWEWWKGLICCGSTIGLADVVPVAELFVVVTLGCAVQPVVELG